MPGSAGHSPLQPREAAKEMLIGHVVSQEPEIETALLWKPCSAVMAVLPLALHGTLPVGCTQPGIGVVWVLSATLFPRH